MSQNSMIIKGVLTIGGSDPSGGAGIQVDTFTLSELGTFPFSVVTAITAQNSLGVVVSYPLPSKIVLDQLKAIFDDFEVTTVKTGMLGSRATAEVIAKFFEKQRIPMVVDPVLKASDGTPLYELSGLSVLKKELFPLATVVTPNINEAQEFAGFSINEMEDVKKAAQVIYGLGMEWVLIKGGHLKGENCPDFLYNGQKLWEFPGERIDSVARGTGCIFASAMAAYLTKVKSVPQASKLAKEYVTQKIKSALPLGKGRPQTLPWSYK